MADHSLLGEKGDQILFKNARTYHHWTNKLIDGGILKNVYDLFKWGPTSTNMCPLRLLFITSVEAKEKLKTGLMDANILQTMQAPVTAIIAYDIKFYEKLDYLSPHNHARTWFEGNEALIHEAALLNSSLQGAYFMLAARAYGLDCGPMSGFDRAKIDQVFFENTNWRSYFLCNLGYGDPTSLHPRAPRLEFDEACQII